MAVSVESRYLVAAGDSSLIFVFDLLEKGDYLVYHLPNGCPSVRDMKFLQKNRLVLLGGDNQVHFIDFSKDKRVILSQAIKGRATVSFDVDFHCKYLLNVTNTGQIYMHDLAKLLKAEETSKNLKLSTGVSSDIVFTTLKPYENIEELLTETSKSTLKKTKNPLTSSQSRLKRPPLQERNGQTFKSEIAQTAQLSGGGTITMGKWQANTGGSEGYPLDFVAEKENLTQSTKSVELLYKTAKLDFNKSRLNRSELSNYLERFGVFPEDHRNLIWRTILELPLNNEAYDNLVTKGVHMTYHNLQKNYPIISNKLLNKLQRILSCLAHYCSVFSEVEFLPDLIFPFVKMFEREEVICFEVIVSFFVQWGQHFLEFHPHPPSTVIQTIEELVKYHDHELHAHFKENKVNLRSYIWLFLHNIFTDILTKQDWLSLMDFLVLNCHEPLYLLLFVVAYLSQFRSSILKTNSLQGIEYFIKKQSSVNMKTIIAKMKDYLQVTPSSILLVAFKDNIPISDPQYPLFNFYPRYTLEQRLKVREQIIKEDQRVEAEREHKREIERLTEEVVRLDSTLKDRKDKLTQADRDRKDLKAYEEDMRLQQKLNIERESREKRLNQMKVLENSIKNSLEHQEKSRSAGLKELEKDMILKAKVENHAIQSRLEEEALLNLEFQTTQRLNEMVEARVREEKTREMTIKTENKERHATLKEFALRDALQREDEEYTLKLELLRAQKSMDENLQQMTEQKRELLSQMMVEDFEKEMSYQDMEKERRLKRMLEEENIKDDEFMSLYKKHEGLVKEEEEKQMRKIYDEERKNTLKRAEERLTLVEREMRLLKNEGTNYRETQKIIDQSQKRSEFEEKILELRRQNQMKQVEEEKKLQKAILAIEEERKVQRETQQDFVYKEREYQEKERTQKLLRETEERILHEEEENFRKFRNTYDRTNRTSQDQSRMNDTRFQGTTPESGDTLRSRADNREDGYSREDRDNRHSRDDGDNRDDGYSRDDKDNRDNRYSRDDRDNKDNYTTENYTTDNNSYQFFDQTQSDERELESLGSTQKNQTRQFDDYGEVRIEGDFLP